MEQMRSEQQPPPRGKLPESQMTAGNNQQPSPPPPPPKKCPRCDSANTKFCYYNNYSLSQPRYFCKSCRRYWTHGGTLRNVPVGGGCRKSKRSKPPSAASTSSSAEIQRNQSLSSPANQTHNLTGMIPGQSLRSLPQAPVIPSISSFYTSGSFLSSLAAMQSFIQQPPIGINQGTAVGANLASTSQFGGGPTIGTGNTALLQGLSLPSLKAQTPQQFQAQNEIYRSQQILVPPTPVISSWAQTIINNRAGNSSASNPSFWGGVTGDNIASGGGDQMGSSLNPNQWSDNHPDYNPSQ